MINKLLISIKTNSGYCTRKMDVFIKLTAVTNALR